MRAFVTTVTIIILVLTMLVGLAASAFFMQDTNTWTEELSGMLSRASGYDITIKEPSITSYWPLALDVHSVTIADEGEVIIELSASGKVELNSRGLSLNEVDISMQGAEVLMSVDIDLLSGGSYRGRLESLDVRVTELDPKLPLATLPFTSLAGSANISGTDAGLDLSAIKLQAVDQQDQNSQVTGNLALGGSLIEADIRIDRLNLPINDSNAKDKPANQQASDPGLQLLPVDLLRSYQIQSIIRVEELNQFNAVKIEVNNNTQEMQLTASAKGYDGTILIALDSQLANPVKSSLLVSAEGVNISKLAAKGGLTGKLQANSSLEFVGITQADLMSSINGKSSFNVTAGSLDVTAIKRLAASIDRIHGKQSSVSNWPDTMPFDQMAGTHLFNQGSRDNQVLSMTLDQISITGTGGFDLVANTIDYKLVARFTGRGEAPFRVNKRLVGINWPMHCKGALTTAPAKLCLGHDKAIANLLKDAVKAEVRQLGRKKIKDKLKEKIPDETTDLLKNLLDL